jgi:hypothetical protein
MQSAEESYETLVRGLLGFHTTIKHIKDFQCAWRKDDCYKAYSIVKINNAVMETYAPVVRHWEGIIQKKGDEPDCRNITVHSMPWGTHLIKIETPDGGVDEIEWLV